MSIFTSRVTKTIDLPTDPGQSVTIRQLAPKHLEEAQKVQQFRSMRDLREMGGATFMKELQTLRDTDAASVAAAISDPLNLFDRVTLLAKGLKGWTYMEDVTSQEVLEDLDEDTAEFIAREILRLSKPRLFQSDEASETDRKNG